MVELLILKATLISGEDFYVQSFETSHRVYSKIFFFLVPNLTTRDLENHSFQKIFF